MSNLLRNFPNDNPMPTIVSANGYYLTTSSGSKILDLSAGATSHMILGWNHPKINEAIKRQLSKFSHVDYKAWTDPNCELLAEMLVSNAKHKLDKVYFCGNSGGEACEAAIKMSYQWHFQAGEPAKQWVISRDQSYHGSSSDAMSLGDRPNLEMYRDILPNKRARICEHNPIRHQQVSETLAQYTLRTTQALENKIIELGPENVASFVGETMMGGLVGDVPPSADYWQKIRDICTKYNVHLILDEVYCGTGVSGEYFCIDYDGITPDFLFMGKTLAAGYAPLSIVMTSSDFEQSVMNSSGRLQHSTTYQGYSLGVAAAIAAQSIILEENFLSHVNQVANFMRNMLISEFSQDHFYKEIRGRGLRFSFEYKTDNNEYFSDQLAKNLLEKHDIYVSAKWHRICFTPSLLLSKNDAEYSISKIIEEMRYLLPQCI